LIMGPIQPHTPLWLWAVMGALVPSRADEAHFPLPPGAFQQPRRRPFPATAVRAFLGLREPIPAAFVR
jgi:hypothetical protein